MHPGILAERNMKALMRMNEASARLAHKLGLDETAANLESIRHRDPQIQMMWRNEALADFFEQLDERLQVVGEVEREPAESGTETAAPGLTWETLVTNLEDAGAKSATLKDVRRLVEAHAEQEKPAVEAPADVPVAAPSEPAPDEPAPDEGAEVG